MLSIHTTQPAGDILVFMTGQDDVEATVHLIQEKTAKDPTREQMLVLPI